MKFFKKFVIFDTSEKNGHLNPYLIRWTLFECKYFQILIHKFIRSDVDDFHDHPWNFISFVLLNGYVESSLSDSERLRKKWLRFESLKKIGVDSGIGISLNNIPIINYDEESIIKRRIKPFSFLTRSAYHAHKIEIEKPCWSLVLTTKRIREWGFYTQEGWLSWQTYFDNKIKNYVNGR